jgi:uncharacterized protein (DUF433 family)
MQPVSVPQGLEGVLSIDPEIMHGDLCFAGTRVPLTVFLDNEEAGVSVEEFSQNYPSVKLAHIQAVIEWKNAAIRQAAGLQRAS